MQSPIPDASTQSPDPAPVSPWIDHLGRVSYLRGHTSLFAIGSVILLALDLLSGDGGVWADTVIALWAVLLVVHGILVVIARLLRELLSEDEESSRPVTETTWRMPGWALPPRPDDTTSSATAFPGPQAAASAEPPAPTVPQSSAGPDRVPWAEATRAAWLARRNRKAAPDAVPEDGAVPQDAPKSDNENNDNDFTPLKFD